MAKATKSPKINIEKESLSSQFRATFGGHVATRMSKKSKEFLAAQEKFEEDIDKALYIFAKQSLIAAYGAWINKFTSLDPKLFDSCDELLRCWLSPMNLNVDLLTIHDAHLLKHEDIINGIRNQKDLSFEIREHLVSCYISFINWLSEITSNYIKSIIDPDYSKRNGRIIDYKIFIKLLDCLDEKNQLVAKLLYFGGTRTLEEVLELDISHIDFKKNLINFKSQLVSYPQHILEDARLLIVNRKAGRVFLGRQEAPLNPSTIFRNFKEAGSRVGLGNSFSPKMLTTNV